MRGWNLIFFRLPKLFATVWPSPVSLKFWVPQKSKTFKYATILFLILGSLGAKEGRQVHFRFFRPLSVCSGKVVNDKMCCFDVILKLKRVRLSRSWINCRTRSWLSACCTAVQFLWLCLRRTKMWFTLYVLIFCLKGRGRGRRQGDLDSGSVEIES